MAERIQSALVPRDPDGDAPAAGAYDAYCNEDGMSAGNSVITNLNEARVLDACVTKTRVVCYDAQIGGENV